MSTASPLPDRGTIAIVAPSSRGVPDEAGINLLKARGFDVRVHAQNALADNQSAGSAAARAQAVMDVFDDKSVHAVMAARGGNRAMHTLPLLDFGRIAANPKPLIGFSDSTALLNAVYARAGVAGYHGPTLSRVARALPAEIDQMIAALQGRGGNLTWAEAQTRAPGQARGVMLGGNLSMMAALCGTPYMPDMKGAILFLEDIGDELSRYDRQLAQLRLAGVFDQIAGLVLGRIDVATDTSSTPYGFTLDDIVAEHIAGLSIPVLAHAPFGHTGPLCTLPVGGIATLDADAKTLSFE